jgi:hypothetical protein
MSNLAAAPQMWPNMDKKNPQSGQACEEPPPTARRERKRAAPTDPSGKHRGAGLACRPFLQLWRSVRVPCACWG